MTDLKTVGLEAIFHEADFLDDDLEVSGGCDQHVICAYERFDPPDGLLFHASGPVVGGWGVLDFWQSREHFDRFQAERIGPALAGIGARRTPTITEFPVHEHYPR